MTEPNARERQIARSVSEGTTSAIYQALADYREEILAHFREVHSFMVDAGEEAEETGNDSYDVLADCLGDTQLHLHSAIAVVVRGDRKP